MDEIKKRDTQILILEARIGILENIVSEFKEMMCQRCGLGGEYSVRVKAALVGYDKVYGQICR